MARDWLGFVIFQGVTTKIPPFLVSFDVLCAATAAPSLLRVLLVSNMCGRSDHRLSCIVRGLLYDADFPSLHQRSYNASPADGRSGSSTSYAQQGVAMIEIVFPAKCSKAASYHFHMAPRIGQLVRFVGVY